MSPRAPAPLAAPARTPAVSAVAHAPRHRRQRWPLSLALAATMPFLAAAVPGHKLADGCPLCANGGALSLDGLPAYDLGAGSGNTNSSAAAAATPASSPVSTSAPGTVSLATAPTPPKPWPKLTKDSAGLPRIGFDHLASFTVTPPPEGAKPTPGSQARLPAEVRALDRQRVSITGYMLPTKLVGGLATEFLIVRSSLMCCYGVTPAPHEWVAVKMQGKGLVPLSDVPLHFTGTLHVGELYEGETFVGFYRLDGEKVSVK